jgi:hypothetical protein
MRSKRNPASTVETRFRRGFAAIAVVLLFASIFALMSAGVGSSVTLGLRNANRINIQKRVRYASYGALQYSIDQLNQNNNWNAGIPANTAVPGDPALVYNVTVYNNFNGTSVLIAPDGSSIPTKMVYILCNADLASEPGLYTGGLASMGFIGTWQFDHAALGTTSIAMDHSITDSYEYAVSNSSFTPNPTDSQQGHLATNGLTSAIALTQSVVNGGAWVGPGAVPSTAVVSDTAGEPIRGINVSHSLYLVPRFCPPFYPGNATSDQAFNGQSTTLAPGGYNSLKLTGGSVLTLTQGDYYFASNVIIDNSKIMVDSTANQTYPCSLYVGRSLLLTNNAQINMDRAPDTSSSTSNPLYVNSYNGPLSLRVFFVGNGAPNSTLDLSMNSNSQACLVAAGKAMQVDMTNAVLWGAVRGATVKMNTSSIHYFVNASGFNETAKTAWTLQGMTTDGDNPLAESDDSGGSSSGDGGGGDGGGDGGE